MTSRPDFWAAAQIPDIERRMASMIRFGIVEELDEANARVRVRAGKVTTGWIPWGALRAGPDRHWSPPEKGEQVLLAAPSGDMAQAMVVGSIYRDRHPAPGNNRNRTVTAWADGATESYDREGHAWALKIPGGGSVSLEAGQASIVITDGAIAITAPMITLNGGVIINGSLSVGGSISGKGDVTAGGVSLQGHTHSGVKRGDEDTDPPDGSGPGTDPYTPVPGSSEEGKVYTITPAADGSRTVRFKDGLTLRTDQYGNQIMAEQQLSGPLPYVQGRGLVTNGEGLKSMEPVGPRLYTDNAGQVLPSVTYQPFDSVQTPSGPQLVPPVTITQTVPAGDPLPANQVKYT